MLYHLRCTGIFYKMDMQQKVGRLKKVQIVPNVKLTRRAKEL